MKVKLNWHATWTPWSSHIDSRTGKEYSTRKRDLYLGVLTVGTLVEASYLRYDIRRGSGRTRYFMYCSGPNGARPAVCESTAFRTAREFIRRLGCTEKR